MAPHLDRRYREWVDRGRPAADPEDGPMAALEDFSPEQLASLQVQLEAQSGNLEGFVLAPPPTEEMPHAASELEALILKGAAVAICDKNDWHLAAAVGDFAEC